MRLRILAVALVALVALGGCQVRSDVAVTMAADGSGTVKVVVALDAEAAAKVPDLATGLRTSDLAAIGWKVVGPVTGKDGGVTITATRPFQTPEQATVVLGELSGADGPFKDLKLARTHSFGTDQYRLDGTLDVSKGADTFADAFFVKALGGRRADQILGGDATATPPTVSLTVRLPGKDAHWSAPLGGPPVTLHATSDHRSSSAFLFAGVAAAAIAGLLLTGALVLVSRIRSRRP